MRPRYEEAEDRQNQTEILSFSVPRLGYTKFIQTTSQEDLDRGVDAYLYWGCSIYAIADARHRPTMTWGKYRDVMMNRAKAEKMWATAQRLGFFVDAFFIVRDNKNIVKAARLRYPDGYELSAERVPDRDESGLDNCPRIRVPLADFVEL
jgi:hypothetical protein